MKRLAGKSTRNKNEVSQTLDASKVLGVDLSNNPRIVDEFGQAVLDRIVTRTTEEQKDVSGKKFARYSKEYVDSEDFAEYGKSQGEINLELTGDMMNSLDFTKSGTEITVQVPSDQAGKAFGNISGKRGKINKSINPRDWFGVSAKDLKEIKSQFRDDIARIKEDDRPSEREVLALETSRFVEQQTAREIFDSIFGDMFDGEG